MATPAPFAKKPPKGAKPAPGKPGKDAKPMPPWLAKGKGMKSGGMKKGC